MPYKISGTLSDAARIVIIKESDWSIESNTNESVGSYEVDELVSGAKLVLGRKSDGEGFGYGNITPEEYQAGGDIGVFSGGEDAEYNVSNVIDYITISSPGNATDFGDLVLGGGRACLSSNSNGANNRGTLGAGYDTTWSDTNVIEYITISSTGNAIDFGDLTTAIEMQAATSNGTNDRGVFGGGSFPTTNVVEYITISSTGNAIDFGDLTAVRNGLGATSNGANERGLFGGGHSTPVNIIDYITISSIGNATDFGDLVQARWGLAGTSNGTNDRGVFGAGDPDSPLNAIDYITISSTGNAQDFGDLTVGRSFPIATSNGTVGVGVFGGGYTGSVSINLIDKITISSTGNAVDFGDLTVARNGLAATSNA